ncbi:uncharacterized protein CIMG_07308 [Coccidioides immitis RS]|uniref:CFEM domain-containing protein n=4 Tax=Coccidioides immitis TaxID=5501 RepID=A0A0E1S2D3_COCIM|nr:uncharacterized protein CIMG_07308 [Coccidioides immitis RS]KMP02423.1 hypothetical protein CIRG_10246 [Coccidioides immitis RMSCC 2394]KMU76692.1 hypothetical protein CISG_05835 [Coccidioides immitis RMSCC 3703]KMU88767.1 hypothetical protein CIHG_06435 [Coccidioides immitis H538.4]TPX26553.1 hypothetical protein DIZ76_012015 [Coccidioides immitis]EAS31829.1 hypothetical protein CIMG_07308 [Coccidioides immitis RS]
MKLSAAIVALAGLVAVTSAQGLGDLPECAQKCATKGIPKDCGIDAKCICTSASFLEAITCCVAQNCTPAEQQESIRYANKICGTVGITDLPQSAVCTTGTAQPSGGSSTSASANTASQATGGSTGSSAPTSTSASSNPNPNPTSDNPPETQTSSPNGAAAALSNANGGAIAAVAALIVAFA